MLISVILVLIMIVLLLLLLLIIILSSDILCLNKDRLCKFSLLVRPWDDDGGGGGGGSGIPTATV